MWDFKAKMYQIQFGPDPAEGAYSAPQTNVTNFCCRLHTPTIVLLVLRVKKLVRENDSFYLEKSGKMNSTK